MRMGRVRSQDQSSRLCHIPHAHQPGASNDSSSTAGSQQGHPRCLKLAKSSTFHSQQPLESPPNYWHKALASCHPMPMKGWPQCRRIRIQKQCPLLAPSSSWIRLQHQGRSPFLPPGPSWTESNLHFL